MGVERAVTRWYTRQQLIEKEIIALQTRLEQLQAADEQATSVDLDAVRQQLGEANECLRDLGPCPRPMMG